MNNYPGSKEIGTPFLPSLLERRGGGRWHGGSSRSLLSVITHGVVCYPSSSEVSFPVDVVNLTSLQVFDKLTHWGLQRRRLRVGTYL